MSAADWSGRMVRVLAEHHVVDDVTWCVCGWGDVENESISNLGYAKHLVSEVEAAGLAAVERETTDAPVWTKRQSPCGLVSHWVGDAEACTCREITSWQRMERDCTPWREVADA